MSPLDYETAPNYTLIIRASDTGKHARYAEFTLFVEVDDVNDNSPQFEKNMTTVDVAETLSIGEELWMKIYKTSVLEIKRKLYAIEGLKGTWAEQIVEEIANFGAENRETYRSSLLSFPLLQSTALAFMTSILSKYVVAK